MNSTGRRSVPTEPVGEDWRTGHEMVEISLLLTREHAALLEQAAGEEGLTVGQLVRRLIRGHCTEKKPGARLG